MDKNYTYSEFKTPQKEYKIAPYDKLNVTVTTNDGFQLIGLGGGQNNQQITGGISFQVEFDGLVKLPILGRIPISGLTIREAEKLLEEKYTKYYNSPFVMINVSNRKVYVFKNGGTVASIVDITTDNFTLIDAIAKTGGLSENSKAYRIRLIRGDINNNPQVFLYNIFKLKDLNNVNMLLEANDIIYVESRPRYVTRVLNEMAPYLSLISTVLLIVGYATLFNK
ncbi:MAG: polysaccharide biosynthesis/export family protein [Bacteroidia bacterium]|nr:polysaccharide biosynthesis/export family protein [Bacteroidia bacterium]